MLLARSQLQIQMPKVWIKTIFLAVAVTSTLLVTGCASKPQINNPTRYAIAPDYYTVRSGDTLSGISMRYGLSYISVAEMNDIAPPYRIYVGQSIRLKKSANNVSRPSTQVLTTAPQIQRQTINLPTQQQPVAPPVTSAPTVPAVTTAQVPVIPAKSTSLRWVKPSNGPIIANFNVTNNIKGLRFGGNQGDPVFAAADGQVVYAADGLKEYGNLVLIKHIDVLTTAKGLGNGFPIGAVMTQGRGVGVLSAGNHGSTYSGTHLGSRIVYTVIDLIQKENIVANAAEIGSYLVEQFRTQLADQNVTVRGFGMMIGIELPKACAELVNIARDEHQLIINVTSGNVVRLLPALNMNQQQADDLLNRLIPAIKNFLA